MASRITPPKHTYYSTTPSPPNVAFAPYGGPGLGLGSGLGGAIGGGYATRAQIQELVRVIRSTPMIDNHAHPLLNQEALGRHPLMSIVTEATGDAIHATSKTLAHHRAVKQLAAVLGCSVPTWEAVVAAIEQRRIESPHDWTARCLEGVETILVDDGLDRPDEAEHFSWHDDFVRSPCKRIVRIEAVAAEVIDSHARLYDASRSPDDLFDMMLDEFDTQIRQAIEDPDVVGFKSVICYRTGLGIPKVVDIAAARDSFSDIVENYALVEDGGGGGSFTRLQHDGLNELFVHHTAVLIRECSSRFRKPIQFHTGLGDNDITLSRATPSLLQEFIRAYPSVPVVLLHASYPFMREAGYLASVYANVYVDIGEVFPCVSQGGQEEVVRQILELCPWSKILWSSDGHWFPETYLLAGIQGREVLEIVLCDYVRKGHIGWQAAIELTRNILFDNSNRLYQLGLSFFELTGGDTTSLGADKDDGVDRSDLELLERHLATRPIPYFVRICWLDYTSTPRMRMVPYKKFLSGLVREEEAGGPCSDIGIPKAALGMLQNDQIVPAVSATGEYRLHPDFSSLRSGPISGHVSMYGEFREQDGSRVVLCPRTQLIRAVGLAGRGGLEFRVGFEVEFLLLQRLLLPHPHAHGGDHQEGAQRGLRYSTLVNDGHAWSHSRYFADPQVARLLRDMVTQLEAIGVDVEQVHAESATGQFEITLPPLPPLEAVDTLLHVRETMAALATAAGYKFSLHPKPFPVGCGTASHVHLSISSPNAADVYESFYAGVLAHLPGILAFTCSSPASYDRLGDGCWAGGRWVTWGTQNREAPLRKIEGSHWEVKCMDGLANPYLALAAILLCGADGVRSSARLTWGDCELDPASLTDNDRKELGVTRMLPGDLPEALEELQADERLEELLTSDLVERYVAVKEAELKLMGTMTAEERREWILERY